MSIYVRYYISTVSFFSEYNMDLETLNLRLKLSDIDPALGAELSRKIEADAENDDTNGLDKNN